MYTLTLTCWSTIPHVFNSQQVELFIKFWNFLFNPLFVCTYVVIFALNICRNETHCSTYWCISYVTCARSPCSWTILRAPEMIWSSPYSLSSSPFTSFMLSFCTSFNIKSTSPFSDSSTFSSNYRRKIKTWAWNIFGVTSNWMQALK